MAPAAELKFLIGARVEKSLAAPALEGRKTPASKYSTQI